MKRKNTLKLLFLSLILSTLNSSCGLIDKFKTPEQPTDAKAPEVATENRPDSGTDDLFSKTMSEKKEGPQTAGTDAPTNITNENQVPKDDIKSLENEVADKTEKEPTPKPAEPEIKQVKVEESLPEIKSELPPPVNATANSDSGKIMSYKVQKGETLMQIAFKIYGDISKWKELKQMNDQKLAKNSALRSGMELKYTAPEQIFVWKPEGTPYMIKTGETLGKISNSVYQTPKKWKIIWENNKPLIKNPNVIYAGFTLYYKENSVAHNTQSESIQESKIDQAISKIQPVNPNEIDLTKETQSATIRDISEEVKVDELQDKALTH